MQNWPNNSAAAMIRPNQSDLIQVNKEEGEELISYRAYSQYYLSATWPGIRLITSIKNFLKSSCASRSCLACLEREVMPTILSSFIK